MESGISETASALIVTKGWIHIPRVDNHYPVFLRIVLAQV